MMTGSSGSNLFLMVWGAITLVLAALFMWRYLAGFQEDNVVILDETEAPFAAEQVIVVAKLQRINSWIKTVGGIWALAFLGMICVWVYRGYVALNGGHQPLGF